MPKLFIMDHGSGHHERLYRQRVGVSRMSVGRWVWRDAPQGEKWNFQFDEDHDGHPIDAFGLPLFGEFIDVVANTY